MIQIATAGYSYSDWVGTVYPAGTKKQDMLSVYAHEFDLVEINTTYYQIPRLDFFYSLMNRVPKEFQFIVKANQCFTHNRKEIEPAIIPFIRIVNPLIEAGRMTALLFQFPYSFKNEISSKEYLLRIRQVFPDLPLAVEFRHRSWISEKTFQFLKENKIAFVSVDEPSLPGLIPPVAVTTGAFAYIRFHGQNKERWWNYQKSYERYDYLYTMKQLEQWIPRIKALERESGTVLVIFNNHFSGKAVQNARMLKQALALEDQNTYKKK